ncbi:hypothetical protein ACFW04_008273 [Cataglyphis niger]
MNMEKLIQDANNNLELFRKTPSNINDSSDNSDCDNIDKDPDYYYSDSNKENISVQLCPTESNNITKSSLETSLNVSGQKICDDINLQVKCSNGCNDAHTIERHLERVHKDEEEVKKFTALPKGNEERMKIIGLRRRRGNYLFNTDAIYKRDLLVCRRSTESKKRTARDFICCAGCKGFFTKNNIRYHFKECTQKQLVDASKYLEEKEDDVIKLTRYDELLITYGNKLYLKYKYQSRLKLLECFLQALKDINKSNRFLQYLSSIDI